MTIELKQIIEALLFSAERPLSIKEIRQIIAEATDDEHPDTVEGFRNAREAQIVVALEEIKMEFDTPQRAFQLVEIAGGWRLMSRPEYAPWLKKLLDEARPHRLSQPALETLSIIALRQPISRADVAGIRGVEVDGVIRSLLERDLITITGRSDAPGKPLLYGTTQRFLEHFGLRNLDDMPKATELRAQAAALKTAEAKAQPTTPAVATGTQAELIPAVATTPATEAPAAADKQPEPVPAEEVAASEDAEEVEGEDDDDDEDEDDDDEEDENED